MAEDRLARRRLNPPALEWDPVQRHGDGDQLLDISESG